MNFDWEKYLKLAHYLVYQVGNPDLSEAAHRSASSRAYYAVFHFVKAVAFNNGLTIPPKNKHIRHADLIEFYQSNNDLEFKNIGIKLERLWKNRKECDYEDQVTNQSYQQLTHESIRYASYVIGWSKTKLSN
jgi:uncharacterized protein (UPF0332 family)